MVRLGMGGSWSSLIEDRLSFTTFEKTYANATDTDIVSKQLDVYGYTYFMSPLVALFPGLLSFYLLKFKRNQYYSNLYTGKNGKVKDLKSYKLVRWWQ